MPATPATTPVTIAGHTYHLAVIDINGRPHTDRAGLAAILGRSTDRVGALADTEPTGFPQGVPDPHHAGRGRRGTWWPIDEALAYRAHLDAARRLDSPGDPEDLLDLGDLAAIRGITTDTARHYAWKAARAWNAGNPSDLLPRPDAGYEPARAGERGQWRAWRWRRATIAAHGLAGRGAPGRRRT
ncbi:hypothetical protein AB0I28_32810 [Phytomonospora sp. NPDC050363]|uniref:hypothetical protein n=1 Tax=Phytomonospora sp. NPDC050363 TaxID=3155642 RepID=UPI0033FB4C0C